MLHLKNQVLKHRIGDVADKQIALAMLGGKQGFGVSDSIAGIFGGFEYLVKRFEFWILRQDSGFQR
jgi:hypothetical protein